VGNVAVLKKGKSNIPKKTKMLPVLNSGDHMCIGRSPGIYSILFASGVMKQSSWEGFHISIQAKSELKVLIDVMQEILKDIENE